MSHWNHRVIKHTKTSVIDKVEETEVWFSIHEVFYDDFGHPRGYTEDAVEPFGETLLELSDDLYRFQEALGKPVLVHEDFFPREGSTHPRDVEPDAIETLRQDRVADENDLWDQLDRASVNASPLSKAENEAWVALGGLDTHPQNISEALRISEQLNSMLDAYDRETGVDSRMMTADIGNSASAEELIVKLQRGFTPVEDVQDLFPRGLPAGAANQAPQMKVFPVPSNRNAEAAQKETGTEIPCPFCKGRVLPRKEWLTGTWCCDKQYKARGLQSY